MAYNFSVERYTEVVEFLKTLSVDASILEVGCGTGNILEFIREETGIKSVYGLDIDTEALEIAKNKELNVYNCSIVDDCDEKIAQKFDVVIVGAVLHHLVTKTRGGSMKLSKKALAKSICLLKADGYLIIVEPTFEPFWVFTIIFYIKRLISLFTSKRVVIFDYWNNIGPPVVSYYSNSKLVNMVESFVNLCIQKAAFKRKPLGTLPRLLFLRRYDATIIAKNTIM
ncbi:MAG: class I SAM-dependent methyltransferase [Caldisericum sp.]|uniref:class I SAM-dependent methyltransferase n=1 Tax=Caldisericum sp. TaxID=2499687 RepID=UPI003D14CA6C